MGGSLQLVNTSDLQLKCGGLLKCNSTGCAEAFVYFNGASDTQDVSEHVFPLWNTCARLCTMGSAALRCHGAAFFSVRWQSSLIALGQVVK